MDTLPRHLQLTLYKGIDTLRALGIRPGRLVVPGSLRDELDHCLRRHDAAVFHSITADDWWSVEVKIPIPDMDKEYVIRRSSKDELVDCTVFLTDDRSDKNWIKRWAVHGMHVRDGLHAFWTYGASHERWS
jgi:hypothetical protein